LSFIDRVVELDMLIKMGVEGRYLPLYIYGPEGCGKTRLLLELSNVLRDREDCVVIYIDALMISSIDSMMRSTSKYVAEVLRSFVEGISEPIGRFLALVLDKFIEYLSKKLSLRNKHVVILVDDVASPIGIDKISWYIKYLQTLNESIAQNYNVASTLIVATTSEGKSLNIVRRHSYIDVKLLWNLDKESSLKLLKKLSVKDEYLWRITGGNPRAMIEIVKDYKLNINDWINKILSIRIEPTIHRVRTRGLIDELRDVCEDIDKLMNYPELEEILIDENLVIYIKTPTIGHRPSRDTELGIGNYYAWQLPIYKDLITKYIEQHMNKQ